MFGTNDDQNNQQQDQTNGAPVPAGPTNDFGTAPTNGGMPPIENTPFAVPASAPSADPDAHATTVVEPGPSHPFNPDLLTIKQDALQELTPLVGHLEQTPEEKFRTTMMMIQAADDQSLVKQAFDAAKAITDDKARAQALLDVINEINYFTQHQS